MISEDDLYELNEEDCKDLYGSEDSCDRVLKNLFGDDEEWKDLKLK